MEVNYTLGNLAAARADSRLAAKRAARHAPVVLAYGESAGAAIAARLAEGGLVDAASAFMAPADLFGGVTNPTARAMIDSANPSHQDRWALSPAMHRAKRPILDQIARHDLLLDTGKQMAWAEADPLVYPQFVEANHVFPTTPEDRVSQLASAMQFLWRKAPRHLRARR